MNIFSAIDHSENYSYYNNNKKNEKNPDYALEYGIDTEKAQDNPFILIHAIMITLLSLGCQQKWRYLSITTLETINYKGAKL